MTKKKRAYNIYALIDTMLNLPFYIGVTCGDLSDRRSSHLSECRGGAQTKKDHYMRSIGFNFHIKSMECFIGTHDEARVKEVEWIKKMSSEGYGLTNKIVTYNLERVKTPGVYLRIPKAYSGLVEELEELANNEGRSLNNYVTRLLEDHIRLNNNILKEHGF